MVGNQQGASAKSAGGRRIDFRGLQLRNRSGWMEAKKNPAGISNSGGAWDWTDEPYSDPRLSPRGLPEPAGRFHRGATRGELDSIISGSVEDANA